MSGQSGDRPVGAGVGQDGEPRAGDRQAGDRPQVAGDYPDGPVAPGGAAAPPESASDVPVSGAADPGASHADPDAARMAGGDQPLAPNQEKTEPMPPSGQGDLPDPAGDRPDEGDGTVDSPGPREGWARPVPTSDHASVPGVGLPDGTPAEGTSEGMAPVEGVTFPSIAPEGLADGENDVAMPSTTTF